MMRLISVRSKVLRTHFATHVIMRASAMRRALSSSSRAFSPLLPNPALTHVLERMKIIDNASSPCLRIYPTALEEGMFSFGRVGAPGPRVLLALDHPAFGKNLPIKLADIHAAYYDRVAPNAETGADVVLCEPSRSVLRRLELVEHLSPEAVKLGTKGHIIPGVVEWTYEDAARSDCYGGWPCFALVPTTPCRLLRFDVKFMWPAAIPDVQVSAASVWAGEATFAPDVVFLRFGTPVDGETTLKQIGMWAEAGDAVEVSIGRGDGKEAVRVPVRFEAAYAREGQRAAQETVHNRRPLGEAAEEMRQAVIGASALGVVVFGLVFWNRFRYNREIDGLRTELSSGDLTMEERAAKTKRWNELQMKLYSVKTGGRQEVAYDRFEPVPQPPEEPQPLDRLGSSLQQDVGDRLRKGRW